MNQDKLVKVLKNVSLFKNFSDNIDDLKHLAGIIQNKKVRSGEKIIEENVIGNEMFILLSGSVLVKKNTLEDEDYVVAKLESMPNYYLFFGEIGLVDNDKRSATVIAETDCELLVIPGAEFEKTSKENPRLGLEITREISKILANRLRRANQDVITLFEALVHEVEDESA